MIFPLRDSIPSRHPPVATVGLITANVTLFLLLWSLPEPRLEEVFYLFGIVPARYAHPVWARWLGLSTDNYWPFLTSIFLHGGWLHLVSNMWMLWIFGDNVEDRMGPWRFVLFYLACGVFAGLVHFLSQPDSRVPTVGASGAIAGVMGAYLLLYPTSRVLTLVLIVIWPLLLEIPAVFFLAFWFATQFLSGSAALAAPHQAGGIAWWAHVGGFIAGMAFVWFFLARRRPPRRSPTSSMQEDWLARRWHVTRDFRDL
ncbi:MAG: rhomboid family intramembrane serine protease [Planctomycetota bacterium]